ncbi:MAG: hypothetical protein R2880_01120 [Deinococcales bacterium]
MALGSLVGYLLSAKAQEGQPWAKATAKPLMWSLALAETLEPSQADALVAQLRSQGLDAYRLGQNGSYQVQISCFIDEISAKYFLQTVSQELFKEWLSPMSFANLQTVPSLSYPESNLCLATEMAFKLPQVWHLEVYSQWLAFHIDLDGHKAYMIFDGEKWYIAQSPEDYQTMVKEIESKQLEIPLNDLEDLSTPISWLNMNDLVIAHLPRENILLAKGQVLWQGQRSALVLGADGNLNLLRLHLFKP